MSQSAKVSIIIGGTSGLGLEIAKLLAHEGPVIITGRKDPDVTGLEFRKYELAQGVKMSASAAAFVKELPEINCFVFAAGFFQEGRVTDLSDKDIEDMIDVGGRSLIYLIRELLTKQASLDELITITSTSQWTPRKLEPIYNFVKAGAGHLSNGLAEDGRIAKVLVVGPAGMATPFWSKEQLDARKDQGMLDPEWVAKQIIALRNTNYLYKYARILRQPPRVELVEERLIIASASEVEKTIS